MVILGTGILNNYHFKGSFGIWVILGFWVVGFRRFRVVAV